MSGKGIDKKIILARDGQTHPGPDYQYKRDASVS